MASSIFPSSGGSGTPGGSSGDLQYNNAGVFGGYTPGTGVVTWLQTPSSANLAAALTDKTGTGPAVFSDSPTITTGVNIGAAGTPTGTNISLVFPSGVGTSSHYALNKGSFSVTDGGVGSPYIDETLSIGTLTPVSGEASLSMVLESKYRNSSVSAFQSEMYFQWVPPSGSPTTRPWFMVIAHDTSAIVQSLYGIVTFGLSDGVTEGFRIDGSNLAFSGSTTPSITVSDVSKTLLITTGSSKVSSLNTAGKLSTPGGLRTDGPLESVTGAIGATFYNRSPPTSGLIVEGPVGLGTFSPTAELHLGAGTASASTAPLKFTSGTNLTTAEAGAMEYNGTNLFFTRAGTTRENVLVSSAVNSVSPTSPNRTLTVNIGGTDYYIAAKTTND